MNAKSSYEAKPWVKLYEPGIPATVDVLFDGVGNADDFVRADAEKLNGTLCVSDLDPARWRPGMTATAPV